ncbi:hypothetical protein QFC21_004713 [Naganishia friedmannii]|uniref:Uncharacterized protein n=1 Tax=Naganishia friedmannii TaxID=89922 RepID=A0ACC2VGD4_9TREE|nr:hypothetical protein QFC21_004713 [Naganishia friedmannii]
MSTAPAAPPSTAYDSTVTLTTASSSAQTMSTAVSSQKLHDPYTSALNPLDRVIDTGSGRILCLADIRGDYKRLNKLVEEHDAVAVIHTGDFGFLDGNSPSRMASRILRHVLLYNPLISPATRQSYLAMQHGPELFSKLNPDSSKPSSFQLSQLGALLSGELELSVPVFPVYGPLEDIRVLEKFRTGEYEVKNLCVLDESMSRSIEIGGLKLRLFGLGGGLQMHRIFDNGEGNGTIAGGNGTIWTTALQIGELVDTAERVYDPSETRILVTHGSIGRDSLLGQVALAVKADLTLSGALHFRFVGSYNDYSVLPDHDSLRAKYEKSQKSFTEVYESARIQLEQYMLPDQRDYLQKALKVANKIPGGTVINGKPSQPIDSDEEQAWKNCWNWNLSEASFGQLIFDIRDGRVSARTYSQGLNFGYRRHQQAQTPQTAKENAPNKINLPQHTNSTQQLPTPATQPSQAAFSKFGQLPRKPIPTGPQRNQSQTAPVRPSPVQGFAGSTKPDAATNGTAGRKSTATETTQPAGPQGGSVYIEGTERGFLRRNDRERSERPVRGVARATQPRINGTGPMTAAPPASRPTSDGNKAEDLASTTTAQPPASVDSKDAPAATPIEQSKEVEADSNAVPAKTENVDDGWGAAPSGDATGLPAPRAPRLVEKNPHTLYVKGLPQPCTDDELRALWKEDIRSKITKTKIPVHPNGQNKDYGYVEFGSDEDMQAALKSNAGAINGTPLSITVSNPPPETGSRRGGFGGRGRGAPGGGPRGGGSGSRGGFTSRGSHRGARTGNSTSA